MVHSKLLRNEVDNTALFGGEGARECKLVTHMIILEQQNARINLQSGCIVHIELGLRRRGLLHRCYRLLLLLLLESRHGRRLHLNWGRSWLDLMNIWLGDWHRRHSKRIWVLNRHIDKGTTAATSERRITFVVARSHGTTAATHHHLLLLLLFLALFFQLHGPHSANSFLTLDTLLFACLEDFLVLDTKLAALDVETVESCDDGVCICCHAEVGKSQTTELSSRVEMVIKRIWGGDRKRRLRQPNLTSVQWVY
jgi:hypothetical protein